MIQISDAVPIQFWRPDCDTWNQRVLEGVFKKEFCQIWNCTDRVRIEFTDTLSDDSSSYQYITLPTQSSWLNYDIGETNWSVGGATPSITFPSTAGISSSDILYFHYNFIAGAKYRITFRVSHTASGSGNIKAYDDSFNEISGIGGGFVLVGTRNITIEFTATENLYYIGFTVAVGPFSASTVTVLSNTGEIMVPDAYQMTIQDEDEADIVTLDFDSTTISGSTTAYGYYYKSFTWSELGICDQQVTVKIYKSTGTPDVLVAVSDGQDVRTSHKESLLITYSNHSNFAGLYYTALSPDQEFNLRIKGTFVKSRMPQERESMQLSSNRVINTFSQIKIQRYLITEPMPFYMQLKIGLILAHQNLYIDQQYWVAEENYELIETDRLSSLEKYNIWLTLKQYVVRNIL